MPLAPDFLASLTCPHPKDLFGRLLNAPRDPGKAVWAWKAEIAPADLYCYLTARFGRPNGPQNFFRNDNSDNLIHWDWWLDFPSGHLHILGMNFRTEVWVAGDIAVTDADRIALAEQIKEDFSNHGRKMGEVRHGLEKWTEFVNPYRRLRKAVEKLQVDLAGLDLQPETQKIEDPSTVEEVESGSWSEVLGRYTKGLGLCFGIRSMLPVMAEAFVNFLLFVLMRPDMKGDERLRENALRQPIDIRVKSLHMTCVGFAKPVDYASPECKAYQSLVNERNDLLHGNVVLEKLRFNEVFFAGKVPVFKTYRSMWERTVGVEINAVGLHRLAGEIQTVDSFIEYVTSCLHPKVKAQIEFIADMHDLGWNEKTGKVGVLFPDRLVDMHAFKRRDAGSQTTEANKSDDVIGQAGDDA